MRNRILGGLSLTALTGSVAVWHLANATPTPTPMLPATPLPSSSAQCQTEEKVVTDLLRDFEGINPYTLDALPARAIRPYQLPVPGIDVMRVVLEETYLIDGIGQETVPLKGWIAVRHGSARPAPGFNELSWETAIVDTEFVGLELTGESKLFGPVHISLDASRPRPLGQVGRIDLPEAAYKKLEAIGQDVSSARPREEHRATRRVAQRAAEPAQKRRIAISRTIKQPLGDVTDMSKGAVPIETLTPEMRAQLRSCNCAAAVQVKIRMPSLKLEMATANPVIWFSIVKTIPPVGETASIALEPVNLISAARKIGVLESGIVKFREVVRFVPIPDSKTACTGAPTRNAS